MKKANITTALIFILFGILIFFESSRFQQTMISDNFIGAAFFPKLMASIMILLALILLISELLNKEAEKVNIGDLFNKKMTISLIGIVILFIYTLILNYIGFILSTILLNLIFLIIFKVKSKITIVATPLLTTFVIYLIFQKMLMVPLPQGIFFF